jgi:hypothetical protein
MNRTEIGARIQALLAKTTENGCTEAEAMSAMMKARELIEKHQFSLSEVELRADGFIQGWTDAPEVRKLNVQYSLMMAVAAFCEVKTWHQDGRVVFFGLRSDVEFATWLLKGLEQFVWQAADVHALESGEKSYLDKRNFCVGCCDRIIERLQTEVMLRKIKPGIMRDNSKSLVVLKSAMVEEEFACLGICLTTSSRSMTIGGSARSGDAGRAAGNKAGFGRPVNGGRAVKAIR